MYKIDRYTVDVLFPKYKGRERARDVLFYPTK